MKVFVSWSKNSRGVGKAVSNAVREIFDPVVETFISQEILAGSRGLDIIDGELNDTDFGIICLTRANQTEQWINYEAGALSRQVEDKRSRMGVLLIDLPGAEEVNSPLDIFQCKVANLEGFTDLMVSLNKLGPTELKEGTLTKRIATAWPDVEKAVQAVVQGEPAPAAKPPKSPNEKIDEVLNLVKAMEASLGDVSAMAQRSLELSLSVARMVDGGESSRRPPVRTRASERPTVIRTMAGEEIARQEIDPVLNNALHEIRSYHPRFARATIGLSGDMIIFRTNGALPQKIKHRVMSALDPFYGPEHIHFVDESASDDEKVDDLSGYNGLQRNAAGDG